MSYRVGGLASWDNNLSGWCFSLIWLNSDLLDSWLFNDSLRWNWPNNSLFSRWAGWDSWRLNNDLLDSWLFNDSLCWDRPSNSLSSWWARWDSWRLHNNFFDDWLLNNSLWWCLASYSLSGWGRGCWWLNDDLLNSWLFDNSLTWGLSRHSLSGGRSCRWFNDNFFNQWLWDNSFRLNLLYDYDFFLWSTFLNNRIILWRKFDLRLGAIWFDLFHWLDNSGTWGWWDNNSFFCLWWLNFWWYRFRQLRLVLFNRLYFLGFRSYIFNNWLVISSLGRWLSVGCLFDWLFSTRFLWRRSHNFSIFCGFKIKVEFIFGLLWGWILWWWLLLSSCFIGGDSLRSNIWVRWVYFDNTVFIDCNI